MFNGERLAPIYAGEKLLLNAQAVIEYANHAGVIVIYVRHSGPSGDLLEHGTSNWQIHPKIAPPDGAKMIDKRTPDAFHETSLMTDLAEAGVGRLLVMGAQTEFCVDTTCRRAFSLGLDVTLVSDGHSTWDNATLTAEQIIKHTNDTLADWFVRLIRADEAADWLGGQPV